MRVKRRLFVFFGMIATGKSYLASHWGRQQGYSYHNSDVVRKRLAGLNPSAGQKEEVDQGIYTSEFSRKTYDELIELAKADLVAENCNGVVLDGSYQSRRERDLVQKELQDFRPLFIYCYCPETVMKTRMDQRKRDPQAVSDGRWEIYLKQKERFELPDELGVDQLININTDQELDHLLGNLDAAVLKLTFEE